MITLDHVNKYFNKGKKNEIHVINDTTLSFPEKGLVALLGPSGCGKTTLLNAIGGLDRVNRGTIAVHGERITSRRVSGIDRIRNAHIGYIFQNFNLLDEMTVSENVAIVLRMAGLKDKEEIRQKTEYALDLVGMYRYRNRFASMLSGGERQRVAIARAIVKNPSIIIADEPTGNLDSKNTLEVMKIIKTISREKLVILVTHEDKLANFFCDRIIRLRDGVVVSDDGNDHGDSLDYKLDNRIYLKDLKTSHRLAAEGFSLELFGEGGEPIRLQIIARDDNVYLKCLNPDKRLEVLDEHSPIELIDDHYREMTQEESKAMALDITRLRNKASGRHASIAGFFPSILAGFKAMAGYSILKKILLAGFFISALFIAYATSNIYGVTDIKDAKFIGDHRDYLRIRVSSVKVADYLTYEKEASVDYLLPGNGQGSFRLSHDQYWQTASYASTVSGSLADAASLGEEDLVAGRLPQNSYEVVLDKLVVDRMLDNDYVLANVGIDSAQDLLGRTIQATHMKDFTIVGIADGKNPTIYVDRQHFINILANSMAGTYAGEGDEAIDVSAEGVELVDAALLEGQVILEKGRMPKDVYEVAVHESHRYDMPLNKLTDIKVNGKKLKVVGYYSSNQQMDLFLVNGTTIKYNLVQGSENITVMPRDKGEAMTALQNLGLNVMDIYKHDRDAFVSSIWSSIKSSVIMAAIIILISLVEIFLIIRASFLSRIKEIGTLRAIGVKKGDIYRMFLGEILAITLVASLTGYVFMCYIVSRLAGITYLEDLFLMNPKVFATGLIAIFAFNGVVGLLPVFGTMRKTPAAILARTDVN